MDAEGDPELQDIFDSATNYVKSIAGNLDSNTLLYLYARFKQAREGPCKTSRPGFFDFQGKQKWDAWKAVENKTKLEAMKEYVDNLTLLEPEWQEKSPENVTQKSGMMGVSVSTMANNEEELLDEDKTVFDWCKDGDTETLKVMFCQKKTDINIKDDEGMGLLHWACDRGHDNVVQLLLKYKADINIQDADGQTPLHYAMSCEHIPVIKTLVAYGASSDMTDTDGCGPADMTSNQDILKLLETR